jgi:hypothetical protein
MQGLFQVSGYFTYTVQSKILGLIFFLNLRHTRKTYTFLIQNKLVHFLKICRKFLFLDLL